MTADNPYGDMDEMLRRELGLTSNQMRERITTELLVQDRAEQPQTLSPHGKHSSPDNCQVMGDVAGNSADYLTARIARDRPDILEAMKPYGTAKRMIEAEVCENHEAFYAFVEAVLGTEWAMKIADNYGDRPGPQDGTVNNPDGVGGKSGKQIDNSYVRNYYQSEGDESKRGNTKTYLSERIAKEFPEQASNIGKGKQYKTITEAARKLGIVKDRQRVTIYIDDPEDAGRYLSGRVSNEWMIACYDAYMKAQG